MSIKSVLGCVALLAMFAPSVWAAAQDEADDNRWSFEPPVRLKGGDEYIATESPGYACPCWYDVDGDGKKDLIVGQFAGGKMKVYRNLGDGTLAAGEWLMVDDKPAQVPGVW